MTEPCETGSEQGSSRTAAKPVARATVRGDTKGLFELSLKRIDDLISVYDKIKTKERKGYERDVLRAAVVSMGAMLEDLIRDVFAIKLGESIAASLRDGSNPLTAEAVKNAVEDALDAFKTQRQKDLYEYLRRTQGGLPPWPEPLRELGKRRNEIAHRGDRGETAALTPIEPDQAKAWRNAVEAFGATLLGKL